MSTEAQRLVQAYVGDGMQVVSRLRSATPLQVIAQGPHRRGQPQPAQADRRQPARRDATSGFQFGIAQGEGIVVRQPAWSPMPADATGQIIRAVDRHDARAQRQAASGSTSLGALDLAETDGLVTTLAEPNLTALSGETASFLAGGEFPIPVSQSTRRGHDRI